MLVSDNRFLILSTIFVTVGYLLAGSLEYNGEPEIRESSTKGGSIRISGGTVVKNPQKWRPYMYIKISLSLANSLICNGVLLSDQLILTAANCVIDESGEIDKTIRQITVTSTTIATNNYEQEIEKICIPRKFEDDHANPNIAVLRMKSPYKFEQLNARPALLPTKPIGESEIAHVVSIGSVDPKQLDMTGKLLRELSMKKKNTCGYNDIRPDVICFQANDPKHQGNACFDDFGAPLLIPTKEGNFTIHGIAIYNKDHTCKEGTAIESPFANIYYLVPEVRNLMKECNKPLPPDPYNVPVN